MLTPLYRALLEASLAYDRLLEPGVSSDAQFTESGCDLLEAEDGLGMILCALVRADAAIGATVGREVLQALAQRLGIEGRADAIYDELSRDAHVFSNDAVETCVHDAARAFTSQSAT